MMRGYCEATLSSDALRESPVQVFAVLEVLRRNCPHKVSLFVLQEDDFESWEGPLSDWTPPICNVCWRSRMIAMEDTHVHWKYLFHIPQSYKFPKSVFLSWMNTIKTSVVVHKVLLFCNNFRLIARAYLHYPFQCNYVTSPESWSKLWMYFWSRFHHPKRNFLCGPLPGFSTIRREVGIAISANLTKAFLKKFVCACEGKRFEDNAGFVDRAIVHISLGRYISFLFEEI